MQRYDDPVEVRRGETGAFGEGPDQFLWRGRLWKVRAVLSHWVETAPWFQAPGESASVQEAPVAEDADLLVERELWRVEAGRGISTSGVFDLSFDFSDGHWQLVGCAD